MAKKVYVGMSGGVDSSVTAALLKEQGYDVTGVYMKNWTQDLPGMICPWKQDYQDAKRVATQLDIPFKVFDFQKEYRQKVVDYMIEEYKAGRTPNPDVMCNQEVKFKLFLNAALADGADLIATGHYARVKDGQLFAGVDPEKDQSYFLCRVTEDALRRTLMPIGELTKKQTRELARKFGLATAEKKDSQGICFVGKVGIKDFLKQFVESKPGNIIDQHGKVIGQHDGALFYTIGQRQGLGIGGGLPYYVVGKSMEKNEVYVTTDLQDKRLWNDEITIAGVHWINNEPNVKVPAKYQARTRYRAELHDVTELKKLDNDNWHIKLKDEVRALTPGQSTVIYEGDRVVGSGLVV